MFSIDADGSVLDRSGKIIFFTTERFISEIANGDCCFICGQRRENVAFNDEHIVPNWLLKRFQLHERKLEIPNQANYRYGGMTIPCCATCNTEMGRLFENPLRELFAGGYEALVQDLKDNGYWRLFNWMTLIFLKTHLKHKYLNYYLDRRKGDLKISEIHPWEEFHHLHCIARSFHTGATVEKEVAGSLFILPAKTRPHFDGFDFIDLTFAQTMLLRVDDIAIVAVLNDSQAVQSIAAENLKRKIGGPLSPLQLREIAATVASINLLLEPRPRFISEIDPYTERYWIGAERPEHVSISEWNYELHGRIMGKLVEDLLKRLRNGHQIGEEVKTGKYTFLTTPDGNFDADSMELEPSAG